MWDKKNRLEKNVQSLKSSAGNVENTEGIVGMVRYLYNEGAFSHYQRLYYLYDTLGSVAQVTSENGPAVQEYLYTPYGGAYNTAADSVNGLRFVGRYGGYTDDDVKLTYFWHRWYDSADGRWVSRDPIGVRGGINLYNYVRNRSQFYIDWYGLCPGGEPILVPLPGPNEPYKDTGMYNYPSQPLFPNKLQNLVGGRHGNYCGAGWSEGKWKKEEEENTYNVVPIDSVDNCCAEHDKCS